MRELPIIYSSPMILAKLAGRKTMTRRTRGLEAVNAAPDDWEFDVCGPGQVVANSHRSIFAKFQHKKTGEEIWLRCPYGQPGDVLYARETWAKIHYEGVDENPTYIFKADWEGDAVKGIWKPSIHMPKAAARIWDEVVSIRVERVQDITEEDAIAEGVIENDDGTYYNYFTQKGYRYEDGVECLLAKGSFQSLWCSINGLASWAPNPWLWAVTTKNLSTTGKPASLCTE